MSDKGIMFTTPMILAITKYKCKTHTRRIESSLKEINKNPDDWRLMETTLGFYNIKTGDCIYPKPRYKVGDVLYLKETWSPVYVSVSHEYGDVCYFEWNDSVHGELEPNASGLKIFRKTDKLPAEFDMGEIGWRSAMLMYKWAARPNRYQVVSVTPKRARNMIDKDAQDEGVDIWWQGLKDRQVDYYQDLVCRYAKLRDPQARVTSEVDEYAVLIDSIDKKTLPWKNNLWLFDYQFREIDSNKGVSL